MLQKQALQQSPEILVASITILAIYAATKGLEMLQFGRIELLSQKLNNSKLKLVSKISLGQS